MSNTDINNKPGERLTFYKLFNERAYNVSIPIIQRDYAQGRASNSEVREQFLDALIVYFEENLPNRDLDFVYGSLVINGETSFIPLDGQQRLTTLFLLHWYLANISDNMILLRSVLTNNGKSKFTYETRTSSSEFCDALMSHDFDMKKLSKPDKDKENSLSKTIKNCSWYYLSWKYDPTIQAMLTMLDSIHYKFSNKPEFFQRLIDKDKPVITFLFLNLDEFKLTDDLYIKMNSRGKQLTQFENFKAKFEQHINNLEFDEKREFYLKFGNTTKKVSIKDYFAHKIDTEWANLFWNYREIINRSTDKNEKDNTFDDELMNFIRVIITSQYAIDCKDDKDDNLEYLIGTQVAKKRKDYLEVISYHKYIGLGVLSNKSVYLLIDTLDKLANGEEKIKTYLSDTFYFDENKTFEKVLSLELTLPQRVQFHAYIRYLIVNNDRTEGIGQWMRVIHNLVQNSIIDGADEVAKAIKSIEKLLPYSSDILSYLKTDNKIDFFTGRQVQEEKIKAHLITKNTLDWRNKVETIEKHNYFDGQIGFILEFSGIIEYFENNENNNNCEWSIEQDNDFFNKFVEYSNKADVTFNLIANNKDFLWERSVLTKGDYLIWTSPWRRNLLSTNKNPRDFSWKRLLRLSPIGTNIEESKNWQKSRSYVKEVFDDINFKENNIIGSLKTICKNIPNDWRKHFVENSELIQYCDQGFIRFVNPSDIILLGQSQLNHYHVEMYTYSLRINAAKLDIKSFSPFTKWEYYAVKSSEEFPLAALEGCCLNRINYDIAIYYNNNVNDNFPNPYQIRFKKSKNNIITSYPDDVLDILESSKYKWHNDKDWEGFWITKNTEVESIEVIKHLCSKLSII